MPGRATAAQRWLCTACAARTGVPWFLPAHPESTCSACGSGPPVDVQILLELRALRQAVTAGEGMASPAITVGEAARRLGCGRTRVFELLREGRLRRARERLGREALVVTASVEALLRDLTGAGAGTRRATRQLVLRRGAEAAARSIEDLDP